MFYSRSLYCSGLLNWKMIWYVTVAENESKVLLRSHNKVWRGSLPKKNKMLLHSCLPWEEHGVPGRPGMLTDDKLPIWRWSLSPPPQPPSHPLSPAGAAAWLCPTKASVTYGLYSMPLHAFAYMCNCVWVCSSARLCLSVLKLSQLYFLLLRCIF